MRIVESTKDSLQLLQGQFVISHKHYHPFKKAISISNRILQGLLGHYNASTKVQTFRNMDPHFHSIPKSTSEMLPMLRTWLIKDQKIKGIL